MCAIFGMAFQQNHNVKNCDMVRSILRKLFLENMVRGRTSSGLAFCSAEEINVIKKNLSAAKFVELDAYKKATEKYLDVSKGRNRETGPVKLSPISVVGHCRLKTKGSELDNKNNHPIVRDNIIGVHNGMIHNDDVLFDRYKGRIKRNGEVDSEIIFALLEYFIGDYGSYSTAIKRTHKIMVGSYACTFVHKRLPHIVWFFRNTSPCTIVYFEKTGLILWSSVKQYIENAVKEYDLGKAVEIGFPRDVGIGIDLHRNKFHRFPLDGEGEKFKCENSLIY